MLALGLAGENIEEYDIPGCEPRNNVASPQKKDALTEHLVPGAQQNRRNMRSDQGTH